MAMKGGYSIVNFGDVNITAENGAVITGVYSTIEATHRKAILVSGITLEGVEKRDCFVDCEAGEGNTFTFSAFGKTFTVTQAAEGETGDKITIA